MSRALRWVTVYVREERRSQNLPSPYAAHIPLARSEQHGGGEGSSKAVMESFFDLTEKKGHFQVLCDIFARRKRQWMASLLENFSLWIKMETNTLLALYLFLG